MGWASGFRAGSDVARNAIDTYYQAQQRRELEAIQNEKPSDIEGYSPQQARAFEGIANTKDADGNAQYQMVPGADGKSYGLAVRNAEGGYDPVQGANFQMGRTTEFMGKRYGEGELTEPMIQGLRTRAMAGVVSKSDPIRGAAMLEQVRQGERAEQQFTDQQEDRQRLKNMDADRKFEFSRLNKLTPQQLAEELGSEFSKDGSGIDAMLTYDEKTGKFLFASKVPGMPSRTMTRAELVNMGMGVWEQGNGDFGRGMQMVMDSIKTDRDLRERDRADATSVAGLNFQADKFKREQALKDRQLGIDESYKNGMLGIYGQRLGLEQAQMERGKFGTLTTMIDEKTGQPVLVQPIMGANGPTFQRVELPGLRMPKQVDPARVEAMAKEMVGTLKPGQKNGEKNGTYTYSEAYAEAQRILYSEPGGDRGGKAPVVQRPDEDPPSAAAAAPVFGLGYAADRAKANPITRSIYDWATKPRAPRFGSTDN